MKDEIKAQGERYFISAALLMVAAVMLVLGITWLPIVGIFCGLACIALAVANLKRGPAARAVKVLVGTGRSQSPSFASLTNSDIIPVAILSTSIATGDPYEFDARQIDPETIRFGPKGAKPIHDITDPVVAAEHLRDANGDGKVDFVFHFPAGKTGITSESKDVCITGATLDGEFIRGCVDLSQNAA